MSSTTGSSKRLQLPVTPQPYKGESWRSVLARAARLNDTTVTRLTAATGLPDDDILAEDDVAIAAELLQLEQSAIRALTLNQWTGTALPATVAVTTSRQGPAWTWIGDRYRCPQCPKERGSLLLWRLPWVTTCVVHDCFLAAEGDHHRPVLLDEDLARSRAFGRMLVECSEDVVRRLTLWRESLFVARVLIGVAIRSSAPPAGRARALRSAGLLAEAVGPEERADALARWCADTGVRLSRARLGARIESREIQDAIDSINSAWSVNRPLISASNGS